MKPTRTTARLAFRLARASHPQQRLRVVLLGTVAAVVAATALFTVGVVHMLAEERQRFDARALDLAAAGEDAAVRVDVRNDTWELTQYPVVWLDPVNASALDALPPGMTTWPAPGGWVISPGLAELADHHPQLAERFPDAQVLGDDGVLHPGELLAYRRLPEGGAMGVNALDAAGFGGSGPTIGEAAELDIPAMTLAMTGFVGLPLLLLAAAGTAVSAPLRAHRLALLRALGVPARQRRRLVVLEAAVAFLPGLAIGGLAWVLGSRWITTIPVVGRPVAEGALTPPRWSIALVLLILAVAFAVLAVVTERRRREDRHAATPRPRAGRPRMAALRAAPALSAIALLAAAAVREGELAATTTLAGVVLLAAGVPLALPLLARAVGDRMARTTSAPAQVLAGRRLQYDPRSAVRPLYGIAALLVITPVVASWITAVRDIDPPAPSDPAAEAMLLRGALGHTDFDALLQGLPDAIAAPMTLTEPGPGSPPGLELGATCPDIGRLLDRPACTSTGDLRPDAEHRLSVLAASPGTVTLVPPEAEFDQLTAESSVLVITPRDPQAESDLRAAALAQPAALTVLSEADRQLKESELVSWILGGIALFSALVFLLLATGLIDRSADGRRGTRLLTALGLTRRRIRNINGQEFLLGYAVVAGTGLAAGIVASLAWSNLDPALSYPFGITMLLAVAAAALAGVGLLGIRLTDREDAPLSG